MERYNGVETVTESRLSVIRLNQGQGLIGKDRLVTPGEEAEYAGELVGHTGRPNIVNTANCIDGRGDLMFADGTDDPDELYNRISWFLTGAVDLAAAKALMGANATIIRDAENFTNLYDISTAFLVSKGIQPSSHEGCAASALAADTVELALPKLEVVESLDMIMKLNEYDKPMLSKITDNKMRKVDAGFMNGWSSEYHAQSVKSKYPANFATLVTADDETHGHFEGSLYAPTDGAFAKNSFIKDAGKYTFCFTQEYAREIANLTGINPEERRTIYLAFMDDLINVLSKITVKGMPVFFDHATEHSQAS